MKNNSESVAAIREAIHESIAKQAKKADDTANKKGVDLVSVTKQLAKRNYEKRSKK